MSHVLGSALIELFIPDAHSLKEKRSVIKGLLARLQGKFNVSVAEVGYNDLWQRSLISVAVTSGSHTEVDRVLDVVVRFVESSFNGDVVSVVKEVF